MKLPSRIQAAGMIVIFLSCWVGAFLINPLALFPIVGVWFGTSLLHLEEVAELRNIKEKSAGEGGLSE